MRPIYLNPLALPLLAVFLVASLLYVAWYTYTSAQAVVQTYMTDTATRQAQSITHFRNFYASEILPLAKAGGMGVSHLYKEVPKSLPLPATLTIDLGHYLSKTEAGYQVALFSAKPFPWRVAERRLDTFQTDALAHLGERRLVELTALVGYYTMVAMTLNAHEIPLPEGVAPAFPLPQHAGLK